MSDINNGLVISVIGMGVTLITLYILTLVIKILIKLFPYKKEIKEDEG
ncbi:MAG: OadG family protein [Chloroflexi bacterium]|nr:OadG family protein [Chloroflexota bacterium]